MILEILGTAVMSSITSVLLYRRLVEQKTLDTEELKNLLHPPQPMAEHVALEDLQETVYIADALDRTTGSNWFIKEDENTWALLATHADGGQAHKLIVVPKNDINAVVPNKFDSEFIIDSHNDYLPTLFDIIDIMQLERDQIVATIEDGLQNVRHTADDYKLLLNQVLSQFNTIEEEED